MELADKGTLFLDEIGELSLALQAKLLRTLQEREFRRRILMLANHFLGQYCHEYEFDLLELSTEVKSVFTTYDWPGNVRELQNVIQHAALMTDNKIITACDLPELF